jgi:hypothetical protein
VTFVFWIFVAFFVNFFSNEHSYKNLFFSDPGI